MRGPPVCTETYIFISFSFYLLKGCSFIIPPKAIPGRMTLLVTLFLVQMQMVKDVQAIIPDLDTLTGISVFALVSLLFIFIALIEYAIILLVARLSDSFKFKIKWSTEIVDLVSMFSYFLGFVLFILSYASLYV